MRGKWEKSFEFVVFWIEADHVRGFYERNFRKLR
jgi:hypothetical protein